MTGKEIYIKETGNEPPDNVYAYSDWYIGYIEWLEKKIEELRPRINTEDHDIIDLSDH